jgi:outer membrane protein assembly factor BamB
MRKYKRLTAILTTAILAFLMTFTLVANAETIYNWNPDQFGESGAPAYMNADNSAYAAASEYGDLMNEDYAWISWLGNGPGRTGFNPGPAPDRPDIIWRSDEIAGLGTPVAGNVAFDGKFFIASRKYLENGTRREYINALNPHTGQLIWQTMVPWQYSLGNAFGATRMFKIDDNHLGIQCNQGVACWRTSGAFLWLDNDIDPGADYHRLVYDPEYMILMGPETHGSSGQMGFGNYTIDGWDLSDPGIDKGDGGRTLWSHTLYQTGRAIQACGDGLVYLGSRATSMVWAVNITTGDVVWQTARNEAAGYAGTYKDGYLIVGCEGTSITCYNGTTGEIIWDNKDGNAVRAFNVWNGLIAYDRTYWHDLGAGIDGATKCLDLFTGEELWAAATLEYIGYYQTVIADGKIYGMQSDGSVTTGREAWPMRFSCWDAITGQEIWGFTPPFVGRGIAWPILAYGCLFLSTGGYGTGEGITFCMSTASEPEPWSMWRGNVEKPGVSGTMGPRDLSVGPKWTFTTGATVQSSPAIDDGKLYINSGDRYVYCLDAYDGSLIWKFLTAEPRMKSFGSSPAVSGNTVVIGPDDGYIYGLDADTGEKLWSVNAGPFSNFYIGSAQWETRSSPIIYQGRVYVASCHNNKMYCLNLNGNIIWTYDTGTPVFGSVAIEDDMIFFCESAGDYRAVSSSEGYSGIMHKLNMAGEQQWNFSIQTDFRSGSFQSRYQSMATPVVTGDYLFVGVNNAYGVCHNATDGSRIWAEENPYVRGERSQGSGVYVPEPGYSGGTFYCQAGPSMAAMRGDNGTNVWSAWGGWQIMASPAFSNWGENGLLYCGSESYGLTCWNATNGAPLSWYTTEGGLTGSPSLWDGKLYIGSHDNRVYCFEDHPEQQMAISISMDKSSMNVGESVGVTGRLTSVPAQVDYMVYGIVRGTPGLPDADVLVTFTDPDGVEHTMTTTTDNRGEASWTYTPDQAGTWRVMTWFEGKRFSTYGRTYAFSDEALLEVTAGGEATPTPTPTPTGSELPMEYVWAAVAVVVIVIVVLVVLLFLRRR